MSLRSQGVSDVLAIIDLDGDAVTLTSPVIPGTPELPGPPVVPAVPAIPGTVYILKGLYNRVGVDTDAEGVTVATDKSTLSISLAAIVSAGLADVEDLKKPGWKVEVADALGVSFVGRIDTPMLDRTLGIGTFTLKKGAP
jgi:hypothetical protein